MYSLDIETMPDLSLVDCLPEVTPSKTLKDPAKIEADIKSKKEKQIESMGLNPLFAQVICICLYNDKEKIAICDESEEKVLTDFWNLVNESTHFLTYNGKKFDFDVLLKRSLRYGLGRFPINKILYRDRNSKNHIDLMDEFCLWGEYEKLDTLGKVYLGDQKIDIDFKDFPELMKTEEGRKTISTYCMKDAELVWNLAKKFGYSVENM